MSYQSSRMEAYASEVSADILECMKKMGCQPILFIGSGLSRRYFNGPSWDELLSRLAKACPLVTREYAYYKQTLGDASVIGQAFAKHYQEWAWTSGRGEFPDELFNPDTKPDAYIKYKITQLLTEITPKSLSEIVDPSAIKEINALRAIKPHSLITTNYDQFLELIFDEYQPIIGQKVISSSAVAVGEIFKIHGCVSQYDSLVLTKDNYDYFLKRKKYLSAKMLTYFSEHPLFFIGYSATDPNIRAILSDIDEALPEVGGIIPNVYIIEWKKDDENTFAKEKLIPIDDKKQVRIKAIETSSFCWVFEALTSQFPLGIGPKLLRALLQRSYELVRSDVPKKQVEANFETLERAVQNSKEFASLFGIATISDPSVFSARYTMTLTDLARKVTGRKSATWHPAQKLIDKIMTDTGIDIKSYDNDYHQAIKYNNNVVHKYSDDAVDLLTAVLKSDNYHIPARPPVAA